MKNIDKTYRILSHPTISFLADRLPASRTGGEPPEIIGSQVLSVSSKTERMITLSDKGECLIAFEIRCGQAANLVV